MPCESGPSFDDIQREKKRIDRQARAACEMARVIRSHSLFHNLSVSTQQWVVDHEREDERRQQRATDNNDRVLSEAKRRFIQALTDLKRADPLNFSQAVDELKRKEE